MGDVAQATALLPGGRARLTLGHAEVSSGAQRDAARPMSGPSQTPSAGAMRLSGLLEVELPMAAAQAGASPASASKSTMQDAAQLKTAASGGAPGMDAALQQTQHREAKAAAAESSDPAGGVATKDGAALEVVTAIATPVWLPAPLPQLHLPLASIVGMPSAARASAEAACQRSLTAAQERESQSGPDHPALAEGPQLQSDAADMVRRALTAVRASGAEGVTQWALGSRLLSPASAQTEAPAQQTDAASEPLRDAQLSAGGGPAPPPAKAANRTKAAATPPRQPDPAAMVAAADCLRPLLHHVLVRRVPGFNHVAYVASEHSQRYLLLPPHHLPAHALPTPPGPSAPVAPAGADSMPGEDHASDAALASEASMGAGTPAGVLQQAPQAPSGALNAKASTSAVTASAQSSTPTVATPLHLMQTAGQANAVRQGDGGQPPATAAPRVAPSKQVIRPWLDHAGGINVPLWRDLTAKAVTLVLRHPGTGSRQPLCVRRPAVLLQTSVKWHHSLCPLVSRTCSSSAGALDWRHVAAHQHTRTGGFCCCQMLTHFCVLRRHPGGHAGWAAGCACAAERARHAWHACCGGAAAPADRTGPSSCAASHLRRRRPCEGHGTGANSGR